MRRTVRVSEHSSQVELVRNVKRGKVAFFAVPNGAKVSEEERGRLLAEGLSPGVPDLIFPAPPGVVNDVELSVLPPRLREAAIAALDALAPLELGERLRVLRVLGLTPGAIELKRERGGETSPHQRKWLARLADAGWRTAIAHGHHEALDLLRRWGFPV